jgi:serine/threonine protein kinase
MNRSLIGQMLGQYELKELLGHGGMAEVYLGYQENLKRHVAVKILPPQYAAEEGFISRFIREAETAASLEHPNIVPILDFGTQSGMNYVVMRLLRGGTLADRVKQRRNSGDELMSLGEIDQLLRQIASALDYAHKHRIVHRDVKPNNIMFDTQGTAFLVDFGIAKPLGVAQNMTNPGTSMGTVAYMSPEQWTGGTITPAVDQYAMGLIIYTLITGKAPFEVPPDAPYALMNKHVNEMPVAAHVARPDLPQEITTVIEPIAATSHWAHLPTISPALSTASPAAMLNRPAFSLFSCRLANRKPMPTEPYRKRPFRWAHLQIYAPPPPSEICARRLKPKMRPCYGPKPCVNRQLCPKPPAANPLPSQPEVAIAG